MFLSRPLSVAPAVAAMLVAVTAPTVVFADDVNVVVVDNVFGDSSPLVDFLEDNFSNVGTVTGGYFSNFDIDTGMPSGWPDPNQVDLVLFGKIINSSQQGDEGDGDEKDFWNGLPQPMILMNAFNAQNINNRWGWFDSMGAQEVDSDGNETAIVNAADPLFSGVTITGGKADLFNVGGVGDNIHSWPVSADVGGATLLATDSDSSHIGITRAAAGDALATNNGTGLVTTYGGDRIYFGLNGFKASGLLGGLTSDGAKVLTNALTEFGLVPLASPKRASTDTFYPITSVTSSTSATDYASVSNLIQGPGTDPTDAGANDGFDENYPHEQLTLTTGDGGHLGDPSPDLWITDLPPGGQTNDDYFATEPPPVLVFDLGSDVPLDEISIWNSTQDTFKNHSVSEYSLRFATEAEGTSGFGTSITFNPDYYLFKNHYTRQGEDFGVTVTARYVEMTIEDNHWGSEGGNRGERVALGEVAFAIPTATGVPGDYNGNGVVDAADYTIYRDTFGSTTDLRADGNGNNEIDSGDYTYWKTRFGNTSGSGSASSAAVPEPSSSVLILLGLVTAGCSVLRKQRAI